MAKKEQMTQAGYDELLRKLDELKQRQNLNLEAIKDARSQGDLSENADYSAAREEQGVINKEIARIEGLIKNAEIIEDVSSDSNLGKLITVRYLNDDFEDTYHLVGSVEADPMNQKISTESPLGKAILKAKKNDVVLVKTEDGDRFEVKVLDIKVPKTEKKSKK